MRKTTDTAIKELRSRDASDYHKSRSALIQAGNEHKAQSRMLGALGERAYRTLESHMKRALSPHRIVWRKDGRHTGADADHFEPTTVAHLSGDIWLTPNDGPPKFGTKISFTMEPRDGAQFDAMVKSLKVAADAMTRAGL